MIRVRTTLPDGASTDRRFHEERVTIGRAPGNLLIVAANKVSSFHGQIHRRGASVYYQDLRSTNGSLHERGACRTAVDGVETVQVELLVGDRLLLGDLSEPVVVELLEVEAPEASVGTVVAQHAVAGFTGMSAITHSRFASTEKVLTAVVDLLHGLTCELDLRGTIRRIGALVLRLLDGAENVWFQLATTRAEPVICVRRVAGGVELDEQSHQMLPSNLVERLEREREALLIHDLPRDLPSASVLRSGWRSVLAAPLFHEEQAVGALVVVGRDSLPSPFSSDEIELCTLVATQTAAALYNANLHERLRQAEQRLRDENRFLRESAASSTRFDE
ncbi:MAG: GAF domain-containing protein, partial [Myxococcales bacterium]|nr:GAF domain-containing protein [Myxococcales bacterium]